MLDKIKNNKLIIGGLVLIVLAIVVPITINQVRNVQETRSRASGEAISLILSPTTKSVTVGEQFGVELFLNAAQNNISAIDITITYDSSKLEGNTNINSENPIFLNNIIFTTMILDTSTPGTIRYVGVNPTSNTISGTSVSVAKMVFTAKTAGTATVGFSNIHVNASGVASALPINTQNTIPGSYTISAVGSISPTITTGSASPTPTSSPTSTPVASPTTTTAPTATSVPTATTSPTSGPTPTQGTTAQTNLSLRLQLVGIGSHTSSGQNNSPAIPTRTIYVKLVNAQNHEIYLPPISGNYVSSSGSYNGTAVAIVPSGPYIVKARMGNTLWKQVSGIQNITAGGSLQLPFTSLVTGDVNADNEINLIDYNLTMACLNKNQLCLN